MCQSLNFYIQIEIQFHNGKSKREEKTCVNRPTCIFHQLYTTR